MSSKSADNSSASVQEVVRSTLGTPSVASSKLWHFFVNGPSPETCPFSMACRMYSYSLPAANGRLNGILSVLVRNTDIKLAPSAFRYTASSDGKSNTAPHVRLESTVR